MKGIVCFRSFKMPFIQRLSSIYPAIHSFIYSFLLVSFLHSVSFSLSPSLRLSVTFVSLVSCINLTSQTKRDTKHGLTVQNYGIELFASACGGRSCLLVFQLIVLSIESKIFFSKTSSTQSPAYGGWGCEVNYLNMKFHFPTSDEGISLASRVCCSWRIWESCLYFVKSSLHKGSMQECVNYSHAYSIEFLLS